MKTEQFVGMFVASERTFLSDSIDTEDKSSEEMFDFWI